jgi:hypothetical protein
MFAGARPAHKVYSWRLGRKPREKPMNVETIQMSGDEAARSADDDMLAFEVSDAALEAAASVLPGAAMSFPNSPTVSILVMCCSDQGEA